MKNLLDYAISEWFKRHSNMDKEDYEMLRRIVYKSAETKGRPLKYENEALDCLRKYPTFKEANGEFIKLTGAHRNTLYRYAKKFGFEVE